MWLERYLYYYSIELLNFLIFSTLPTFVLRPTVYSIRKKWTRYLTYINHVDNVLIILWWSNAWNVIDETVTVKSIPYVIYATGLICVILWRANRTLNEKVFCIRDGFRVPIVLTKIWGHWPNIVPVKPLNKDVFNMYMKFNIVSFM